MRKISIYFFAVFICFLFVFSPVFIKVYAEDSIIGNEELAEKETITLIVGEEKEIDKNIFVKLDKLLEINEGEDCSRQNPELCYSHLEIKTEKEIKIFTLYKYRLSQISDSLAISLLNKENENSGLFEIRRGQVEPSGMALEQQIIPSPAGDIKEEVVNIGQISHFPKPTITEIQIDNSVSEPIPYQIVNPQIGVKDFIIISNDKISIHNEEKEKEITEVAPTVGVKDVIRIEVGDKDLDSKEINIKPAKDKVILEVVKGATNEDCGWYLAECKKGDEVLCQKYDFNCSNLEKQTCENYLLSCKKGNEEACLKWNLNCKKEEITPETCGKLLSLCQSGFTESCKEYNVSCQQKEITTASTKEKLRVKENKVFMEITTEGGKSESKEIKIMPDTASEKAIETLSLKKEVEIELKDTGKPSYEITGSQEKRIFGLFKVNVKVKTDVDAETGELEKTKKSWWSFLAW